MTINPLVAAFFAPSRGAHTVAGETPEWQGRKCEVGRTHAGKMYCALNCDGSHCEDEATPELLADFARYDAARKAHNRKATVEGNRIRRKVENIPGADKEGRQSIA